MKAISAVLFIIVFIACSNNLLAGEPVMNTPEDVIKGLYAEYQPDGYKKMNEKLRRALGMKFDNRGILMRYFDENLTRLFLKDDKCKKASGEICNLDFDPVLNAQDYDEETSFNLKMKRISEKPLKVKVTFTNIDTRSLVYEFSGTKNGYRICDIIYPEGQSLKKLLSQS